MRKLLLPRLTKVVLIAATGAGIQPVNVKDTEVKNKSKNTKSTADKGGQWCRPSELPIYSTKKSPSRPPAPREPQDSEIHQKLERNIHDMRCRVENTTDEMFGQAGPHLEQAKRKFHNTVDYLNEPQNSTQRVAAVALGGLVGFIFAIRGGIIKKTIYMSLGAAAVASVCYPREAEEHARNAYFECRKTVTIAYNYFRGLRDDDADNEMTIEPINKYPSTLEDFKHLATEIYLNGKELLFARKKSS